MIEVLSIRDMRRWRAARQQDGQRVGLVPTMGALHEGHLRLVDRARDRADAVVVSVFVNPTQFGPGEDFDRYPRDRARDRDLAEGRGVACLFAPETDEMYPRPTAVQLAPGTLGAHLCGPHRPGHFSGVMLVVLKLFNIVQPDVAVFGRKDAQQALILRRMTDDLNLPIAIDVAPTVREPDGLALSSRNAYLSAPDRRAAAVIPRALDVGHRAFAAGTTDAGTVLHAVRASLAREPGLDVEYVDVVDPDSVEPVSHVTAEAILAVAVRVGATRLIDNIPVGEGLAADDLLAD